jgi:hypothetical protein
MTYVYASNRINNFKLYKHRIRVKLWNVIAQIINPLTGLLTTVSLLKNTGYRYSSTAKILCRIVRVRLLCIICIWVNISPTYAYIIRIGDVAPRPSSSDFSSARNWISCDPGLYWRFLLFSFMNWSTKVTRITQLQKSAKKYKFIRFVKMFNRTKNCYAITYNKVNY